MDECQGGKVVLWTYVGWMNVGLLRVAWINVLEVSLSRSLFIVNINQTETLSSTNELSCLLHINDITSINPIFDVKIDLMNSLYEYFLLSPNANLYSFHLYANNIWKIMYSFE